MCNMRSRFNDLATSHHVDGETVRAIHNVRRETTAENLTRYGARTIGLHDYGSGHMQSYLLEVCVNK